MPKLVGHLKGGLGHVVVVSAMIFAGMTGAAVAEAAAIGTVGLEGMTKRGFDRKFCAAIIASASTIGPVIPPSIPLVIYCNITGTSVGRLFLAAFSQVFYGHYTHGHCLHRCHQAGLPQREEGHLQRTHESVCGASTAVLTPVIIIGGMVSGIFTPTEASVIAAVYALLLTMLLYGEVKIKDLPRILWETLDLQSASCSLSRQPASSDGFSFTRRSPRRSFTGSCP